MSFIGLISDTHGLLRPAALEAMRGAACILHAGDVGSREVIDGLKELAPVIAVRGNIDTTGWCATLPIHAIAQTAFGPAYLLHDREQLDFDPAARGYRFVISGHTHKAVHEISSEVAYINPGSAGPRRFRLPAMIARLYAESTGYLLELIELAV